jgi:ketosteroid isomerase-like protein
MKDENETDLDAIDLLHQKDMSASMRRDIDTLVSLWTEDAVALPPDRPPVKGIGAIRRMVEESLAQLEGYTVKDYLVDFEEVEIVGNLAYEWGTYRACYVPEHEGHRVQTGGSIMRLLERSNKGEWRVKRAMWTTESDTRVDY